MFRSKAPSIRFYFSIFTVYSNVCYFVISCRLLINSLFSSCNSCRSQIAHCKVEGTSRLRCLLPPFSAAPARNASFAEPLRERLALHLLQADDCAAQDANRVRRDLLLTLTRSQSAAATDSDSPSDDYSDPAEPVGPFVVEVHPDPVFEPLSADRQPLFLAQSPLLIRVCATGHSDQFSGSLSLS